LKTDPAVYKNYFSAMNISASGLHTQRKKLDIISMNIANINTLQTEEGGPYKRQILIQEAQNRNIFEKMLDDEALQLDKTNELHFNLEKNQYESHPEKLRGVDGQIQIDPAEPIKVYDPNHPLANEEGYVLKPNINIMTEMVDLVAAQKEYDANVAAISAFKSFAKSALNI
jgi:flagellar basal-body rod protein FlgC